MTAVAFTLPDGRRIRPEVSRLFMAGYTGRDAASVKRHIDEMALKGVSPPSTTPSYHPVMTCLLTQSDCIQVSGTKTLPEVEFVIFGWEGRLFVTVGNDQYDIEMERVGQLARSKNLGQKPIGRSAWPFESVRDHWDRILLEMHVDGVLVQQGIVGEILRPEALMAAASQVSHGTMVFGGTVPFVGDLPDEAGEFTISLRDPVESEVIRHDFSIHVVGRREGGGVPISRPPAPEATLPSVG